MKRSFSIIVLIFIVGLAAVAGAQERPKYVDGEVIVKFKSHVTDTDSAVSIQKAGGISARSIGPAKRRAYRIKLPAGLSVERAIERFKADPNVEYVEPNYIYYLNTTPDDPNFTEQMGLNNTVSS